MCVCVCMCVGGGGGGGYCLLIVHITGPGMVYYILSCA